MRTLRTPAGFTLIEMLVVVLIVGVITAGVMLSVSLTGGDHELQTETERLATLMNYARDEAELQTRELGLVCSAHGYQFLAFDPRTALWGGIDEDEDSYKAALRELYEETSIRSVQKLGEIEDWLAYDIPRQIAGEAWNGKYRGQKQKWYALQFTGKDSEIDVAHPGGGHKPEFVEWRWATMAELPDLVVPFKRQTYERVVKEFGKFART